jgi:branched-chain amino acid transport system permease protein
MIMITIGFGALVRGAAALSFRGIPGTIPLPFPQEPLPPLGFPVPADRLAAVTCCFRESRTGLALRAIADDQQAAMAVGIDIDRHFSITWALVGVLCVLAGTLWASVSGGEFGRVLLGIK